MGEDDTNIGNVAWVTRGDNVLMMACLGGHLELVNALRMRGADVHATNNNNQNALMFACWKGHRAVAAVLLDAGVDVNAISISGRTAVHYAAYYDHPDICLLLLSRGADLMTVDINNETGLDLYGNGIFHHPPTHSRPALSDAV